MILQYKNNTTLQKESEPTGTWACQQKPTGTWVNQQKPTGTWALRLLTIFVLMLAWALPTKAQVQEGLYYIGSRGYNVSNTTTNYYLCPTEDWNYFVTPNTYTGTDNGQPFMTTYQCRNGVYDSKNALWVVKQSPTPDYFYIIHLVDGKYLTYNV